MNKIYLIGNMSKDIQITELQSGKKVGKFGLAVKRKYGEDMVDFINIVIWDKLADNVQKYCSKGSKIAVVGELQTRMYEVNGEKRYTYEVQANEIEFLSIKKEEEKVELKPITDDDCPF
jgi:single-strand DNA-binding protein